MAGLNKIISNSIHFISSNLVNFVLGTVASIVLARTLQANKLGIFHQVQWFTGLISTFISLGFITCIIKFTAQHNGSNNSDKAQSIIKFIIRIELAIALVSTAILAFFSTSISDHYFSPNESNLFFISFLALTPGIQTAIFSAVLEGNQVFKYQNIHAFTITPLSLITKITLMVLGYEVMSLIWCNLAFAIINLIYYFYAVKREKLFNSWNKIDSINHEDKKEILKYNRSVFSITVIDLIVWSRSENYFLGRFSDASQLAYYNLAQNLIIRFTGIIPSLMWRILLPVAAEQEGKNNSEYRQKTYYHSLRYSAFLVFPLVTGCFIAAYELIVIFYGIEYAPVEECFQILCIGALITSLSQPGSAVIYAANKQRFIFWYGGILAILNIGLDFWLIPIYGAVGASICFTTVTSLGTIGGFVYTTKFLHLKVPVVTLLKIGISCITMGLTLFYVMRLDSSYFNLLQFVIEFFHNLFGVNTTILFGERTIRVMFGMGISSIVYLITAFILFTPHEDDERILLALKKYFPNFIIDLLIKKGK